MPEHAAPLAPAAVLRRVGLSLTQGLVLYWLYRAARDGHWPATNPGLISALVSVGLLLPVAGYLLDGVGDARRRAWALAGMGLALLGFGWHHGALATVVPSGPDTRGELALQSASYLLVLGVLLGHSLPFVQAWLQRGRARPHYPDLFEFAWRNAILLALGLVFCGVFWLLLGLWAQLFQLLGIEFFGKLFRNSSFAIPATAVAAGVGVQLAGNVETLQRALRQNLLSLLKWLAPLSMSILVLFSAALLLRFPELLDGQRRIVGAAWLLWLVAVNVLLLNAAYQDGHASLPYPRLLAAALRVATPLLVVIAGIALYAVIVRIGDHGLTVQRAWALLVAVLALVYALGYALAALAAQRTGWMALMGAVNIGVALATVAVLTLMLTPLLAPTRLAANSQHDRILADPDAAVEEDYRVLRFESGEYGRDRLRRLAALEAHPDAEQIREAAQAMLDRADRWPPGHIEPDTRPLVLEAFPAGAQIDDSLRAALAAAEYTRAMQDGQPRSVLFVDLDGDGTDEAVAFVAPYLAPVFRRAGETWSQVGNLRPTYGVPPDVERVRAALSAGRVGTQASAWRELELDGDERYVVEPLPPQPPAARPR